MSRINIAIASPGDVLPEREAAMKVCVRWNSDNDDYTINPSMFEHAAIPTLGDHPQHILNRQIIAKSELLIAIFWHRLGTPTPTAPSGTVEEIREFIKLKGPARVMLYFCTRPLPYDHDRKEFDRLSEFRTEMQWEGVYHEFDSVEQFGGDLYRHLDAKINQLLSGQLPVPARTDDKVSQSGNSKKHPDDRLNHPILLGDSLAEIAANFSKRLDQFDAIDGSGPDKYLDLGAHVYTSAAMSLDSVLAKHQRTLSHGNATVVERLSTRLKRLVSERESYVSKFPAFWSEGREICKDLQSHVAHIERTTATW